MVLILLWVWKLFGSSFEGVLKLFWSGISSSMSYCKLFWNCFFSYKTVLKLLFEFFLKLHCKWLEMFLKLVWSYFKTVLKLLWNCFETALKLLENCFKTVLQLYFEIVLILLSVTVNCFETGLKRFLNDFDTTYFETVFHLLLYLLHWICFKRMLFTFYWIILDEKTAKSHFEMSNLTFWRWVRNCWISR